MNSEAYEAKKREAAAQVDQWFTGNPEHWREKAKEILERHNAYEHGESTFHPILYWTLGWTGSETLIPEFAGEDADKTLPCYYAVLIVLHDTAGQGYKSIAADIWPGYESPKALPTGKDRRDIWLVYGRPGGLWNLVSFAFHPEYGDKSGFIDAALRAVTEELAAAEQKTKHNNDFTTVHWYGTPYTFAPGVQGRAVAALWQEWEKTGLGLHQQTIGEAADSSADKGTFRMDHTFRNHPAFGKMIQPCGDGRYTLCPPDSESKPARKPRKKPKPTKKTRKR